MTANPILTPPTRSRGPHRALWILQILLAVFFMVAAAGPKLLGEATAVEMFALIGAGQWLRYLVGGLELAGAIGLLIPRLAGPAAVGLAGVMVGAALTQLFVLDAPVMAITPAVLLVVFIVIARARWPRTRSESSDRAR